MPTALIVEDEPEANKLLAMLVRMRGYVTDSAHTGGEALASVGRSAPDVVLLDLMLPDLNGYEVCAALKSRKETALIPVVMVTARVALENRLQSFAAGADQYVPKPYTPDQIFDALAEAGRWRGEIERLSRAGTVPLGSRDDGAALREIGRLGAVLLACTPLDAGEVANLTEALRAFAEEADAWGQSRGASAVATLAYEVGPDGLALTLHDHAGWFEGPPRGEGSPWPRLAARAGLQGLGEAVALLKPYPHDDDAGRRCR